MYKSVQTYWTNRVLKNATEFSFLDWTQKFRVTIVNNKKKRYNHPSQNIGRKTKYVFRAFS